MRLLAMITTTLALVTGASHAEANDPVKIYPYASEVNYCPAGLQPVTISGVICCGVPSEKVSYQSVMSHPAPFRKRVRTTPDCPVGTKGCRSQ